MPATIITSQGEATITAGVWVSENEMLQDNLNNFATPYVIGIKRDPYSDVKAANYAVKIFGGTLKRTSLANEPNDDH